MDGETRSPVSLDEHTALVASSDPQFQGVVGGLLARAALRADHPLLEEPAWLSFTRVQPRLVVCDARDSGAEGAKLVVEAEARHIPVLVLVPAGGTGDWGAVVADHELATLDFPIGAPVFAAAVDALLDAADPTPGPADGAPRVAARAPDDAAQEGFPDWRRRLRRNLSRRSDGRWDPLTHAIDRPTQD